MQLTFYNTSEITKKYAKGTIPSRGSYLVPKSMEIYWVSDAQVISDVSSQILSVSTGQDKMTGDPAVHLLKQILYRYESASVLGNPFPQVPYGIGGYVSTSLPYKCATGSLASFSMNPFGILSTEHGAYARWGCLYSANVDPFSLGATSEQPIFLMLNASSSLKLARFRRWILGAPIFQAPGTLGTVAGTDNIYRFYLNPTISANGSSVTVNNMRQTAKNLISATLTAFKQPTISANGTLIMSLDVITGGSSPFVIEDNFSRWLEPGNNLLVTAQQNNNSNKVSLYAEYMEEAI